MTARLAVDIGGTFTDVVLEREGTLTSVKIPTTPREPEAAFVEGVRAALEEAGTTPPAVSSIIHGTTLATNVLIERKGARVALITTEGFRDSLEIGYEARYDQYDIYLEKPPPLVPRYLRFTLPERVNAKGEVLTPLDEQRARSLLPALEALGVESIAVGFLHSYANAAHEERMRELIAERFPELALTLSADVCPEVREYERLSTAVANAYVQPLMSRYLRSLERRLEGLGFTCPLYLVTSAGHVTTLDAAARHPIRLVESGPSGGAVLARSIAKQCEERSVLSYDMGGTTAKICLVEDYEPRTARQFEVARASRFNKGSGLPLRIPVIEMIEIGAGGGSIAQLDALGRLTVGPQSAGAEPGPACYQRGGEAATVTDADLLLGRLDPARFGDGRVSLEPALAREAIARHLAERLGMTVMEAAAGIAEIVDENMANAARVHALEQGIDVTGCTMIAFGGAGPIHAGRIAAKLGVGKIIVPVDPSVGSAIGFLRAPVAFELVQSYFCTLSRFDHEGVNALFEALEAQARAVVAPGAGDAELAEERVALMRFRGQGHEIEVEVPLGTITAETPKELRARYDERYAQLFGRTRLGVEIEVLSWALKLSAPAAPAPLVRAAGAGAGAIAKGTRSLFRPEDLAAAEAPWYWRPDLRTADRIEGPALVVEAQTTTLVPAGWAAAVDAFSNLVIEPREESGHE